MWRLGHPGEVKLFRFVISGATHGNNLICGAILLQVRIFGTTLNNVSVRYYYFCQGALSTLGRFCGAQSIFAYPRVYS